jgi:signal transduction histidine kinase
MDAAPQIGRHHLFNLLLRAGTAAVIWIFCLFAWIAGTVRTVNLQGVGISCAFILLTCVPSFFIVRRMGRGPGAKPFSVVDRLLVIVGYTGVVYSLGGIEAGYLIPLYALFTMYIGFASPWRLPFTTAIQCLVCFSFIVVGEHLGIIPSLKVGEAFHLEWNYQLAILGVTTGFLFASAFISSAAARLIDEGRNRLKERNAELVRARDRAQESDRKKSEFLANMSHELRTPLHHVIGFTELVMEDEEHRLDAAHRDSLDEVLSSAQHLLSLINEVLDTAKVEAGKVDLDPQMVELPEILRRGLAAGKQAAARRGIEVTSDFGAMPQQAWVDERKVLQVLFNLMDNAVKFTEPGGRVILRAREYAPGFLEVGVSDSGIGIRSDDMERIFLPFERAEDGPGARVPGTGLGLSLARKLVELHGGRLWAESQGEGRGSTFRLTLPITAPPSEPPR